MFGKYLLILLALIYNHFSPTYKYLTQKDKKKFVFKWLLNAYQQIKQYGSLKNSKNNFQVHFRRPILEITFLTIFRPQVKNFFKKDKMI